MGLSGREVGREGGWGLSLSDWAVPWCARRVCTHSPRSTSHQQSMPSLPPLTSIVPVGLQASAYTISLSSLNVCRSSPLWAPLRAHQTKSSPLPRPPPPLARRVPSGLQATLITIPRCPCRRACCVPLEASHRMTLRSGEHTSELQSPDHLVCPLLPVKK